MTRMFKGVMIGSMIGMATAMMAMGSMQPKISRQMMRKGRSFARQIRRKFADMDMN